LKAAVRKVTASDARAICDIYNHYVAHTIITFEQHAVSMPDMGARIEQVAREYPWLVIETSDGVLAYAYATRWRSRAAYDRTVESTVYVRHDRLGAGLGFPLYMALLDALRQQSVHAAVGCIALPNPGSVAFDERCGFEKAGHFPQVGRKFDRWVDVGFWQILL